MMLELKGSSLPPWWRALAVARLARSQARTGDEESARVLARDAVLLMNERSPTPPPPALGPDDLHETRPLRRRPGLHARQEQHQRTPARPPQALRRGPALPAADPAAPGGLLRAGPLSPLTV